jgi:hypothetical protein
MAFQVDIKGMDKLDDALAELSKQATGHMAEALREEAEIEMTEAKKRTPVEWGTLRGSGRVEGPEYKGKDVEVKLQFGSAAAPYALYVHEDLDAFHKVGRSKFLESTLVESIPHLAKRIAARIAMKLGI